MGLRAGCAIGVVLAMGSVARPSRAEVVYYNPNPTPVDVRLSSTVPNSTLEIYQPSQRPGRLPPLVACRDQCAFKLAPGDYKVLIAGAPGTDVYRSSRNFELVRPSSVTVDPPSAGAHYAGLALGITGPIAFALGTVLLLSGGLASGSMHSDATTGAGAALMLGGAGITVVGWVLFGTNRKPTLAIAPLRPAEPAPR